MKLSAPIKSKKGFTLIELLVVIGILAVLLAITLIAINPARQFAKTNNTKRQADVGAILNAVSQYMANKGGLLPANISLTDTNIGSGVTDANICADLVTGNYIAALPADPNFTGAHFISCADYDLGYTISKNSFNRVTVKSPHVEAVDGVTTPISVTR